MARHLISDDWQRLVAPELLPVLASLPSFELNDRAVAAARSRAANLTSLDVPPALQAVSREERFVPGLAGAPDVRVLIYGHEGGRSRPAYLHLHGGGFVVGSPEFDDLNNRQLALDLGCVVASVDYRLAPETRFPGAVEDSYAVLLWLHRNARSLGIDPARIAIGGESAGGGLAATLALLARARNEVAICAQVIDAGMLDDRTGSTAEAHPYCDKFLWTPATNRFCWQAYLGREPAGPDAPDIAAPVRAANLSGLPPASIVVGSLDLLLEENLEYARRLARAGVPTELHVIPGAFHGFAVGSSETPQVKTLLRFKREALARAFGP